MSRFGCLLFVVVAWIASLGWAFELPPVNYDEAQVPAYTLPDPLVCEDGTVVRDAATWFQKRRPELLRLFQIHVYGKSPGRPAELSFRMKSRDDNALDGKAVKACSLFAVQCDGREIVTIEGLAADGRLHPLQEAFWNEHALQCGYCTPGMIMAARQLLERTPRPTEAEIRHGLEGNLCRCTGYQHIVNAVKAAAAAIGG